MAETRSEPNECVVYTRGFKMRIQGNVVMPGQVFGKSMTLMDFLNQHETVGVERYTYYRREGVDFIPEKPAKGIDPRTVAHIPTPSISLMHGYVQYGALSKLDDDRLKSLGYEEIPVFVHYQVAPHQPDELIYGRVLGKVASGYTDPLKARTEAVQNYFKSRPHFIALRDPSNALLHMWFNQEHWQREGHIQQPPSIVLSRRLITFFGLQKTEGDS